MIFLTYLIAEKYFSALGKLDGFFVFVLTHNHREWCHSTELGELSRSRGGRSCASCGATCKKLPRNMTSNKGASRSATFLFH